MKKMFLLLLFIFSSENIFAADVFITINGAKKKVDYINLDGNIFINYEQFFKLFNTKLNNERSFYLLKDKNIIISTYPMSFYILLSNEMDEHIIQLNIPVYEFSDALYIPVNSMMSGLKKIFGIDYDMLENSIYVNFNDSIRNYFKPILPIKKELPQIVKQKENIIQNHTYEIEQEVVKSEREKEVKKNSINIQQIQIENLIKHYEESKNKIVENTIVQDTNKIEINIQEPESFFYVDLTKSIKSNIEHPEMMQYSLSKIKKPALSSLSYSIGSFIIDKQKRQLFDNSNNNSNAENIKMENNSTFPYLLPAITAPTENKALPPFRKYSIPAYLKKTEIQNLK